uniref:hypothetical protein n=1 Tax=Uabimicrobium amorphum TaxID=2596890 RepID=UPI0034A50243
MRYSVYFANNSVTTLYILNDKTFAFINEDSLVVSWQICHHNERFVDKNMKYISAYRLYKKHIAVSRKL